MACRPLNLESLNARRNTLLACLPDEQWQHWQPLLEPVDLPQGMVLYEAGAQQRYVYFPTNAIVSMLNVLGDGASAAFAVVGFEGLIGLATFMGGGSVPNHAVVQSAGMGYRIDSAAFQVGFESSEAVKHLVLRYTQALITQVTQTAVCNRHHTLEKQLGRWLLLQLDRLPDNEVLATQGQIASTLGVRREGVTEAALKLQAAGMIRCARGHTWVLDRTRLEESTCECYRVVRSEYDRLLASPLPANNASRW